MAHFAPRGKELLVVDEQLEGAQDVGSPDGVVVLHQHVAESACDDSFAC